MKFVGLNFVKTDISVNITPYKLFWLKNCTCYHMEINSNSKAEISIPQRKLLITKFYGFMAELQAFEQRRQMKLDILMMPKYCYN